MVVPLSVIATLLIRLRIRGLFPFSHFFQRWTLTLPGKENRAGRDKVSRTTINELNYHVLLNIFNWYRIDNTTEDSDGGWNLDRWWYKLVQVCRVWRGIILAHPTHLDLHLVCTYGTPVETMLSHSPPFPLTIYYPGKLGAVDAMSDEDKRGAIFVLRQRERVRRVHIAAPAASLHDLVGAMDNEYPILQRLIIRSQAQRPENHSDTRIRNRNRSDNVTVTLRAEFRAPLMHRLILSNVAIPTSSRLLSSAGSDLVWITLQNLPASSPDFHPAHLTAQLGALSRLEVLTVHFSVAIPNRDVRRRLQGASTTRVVLPRLRRLAYRGGSTYLEGILARLETPELRTMNVEFFNQLSFSLPSLLQFARTTAFTFRSAELHFDQNFASLIVDPLDKHAGGDDGRRPHPLLMQVKGEPLDWQVTSISQICSAIAPLLAQTEVLTLGFHKGGPDPAAAGTAEAGVAEAAAGWQGGDIAVDRAQWRALLRIFAGVKTVQLTGGRVGDLFRAIQPRHSESNNSGNGIGGGEDEGNGDGEDGGAFSPEILPVLQKLALRGWGIADDVFNSFIAASDAAGRTVRLIRNKL